MTVTITDNTRPPEPNTEPVSPVRVVVITRGPVMWEPARLATWAEELTAAIPAPRFDPVPKRDTTADDHRAFLRRVEKRRRKKRLAKRSK